MVHNQTMRASSVTSLVLQALEKSQARHLTAQELYEQVRQQLPAVNPSTVYRTLDRLVQAGRVSISDMGTGAAVYQVITGGIHHHLVCQGCRRVFEIDHEDVAAFFARIKISRHFQVATNHLVLFGICEDCSRKLE